MMQRGKSILIQDNDLRLLAALGGLQIAAVMFVRIAMTQGPDEFQQASILHHNAMQIVRSTVGLISLTNDWAVLGPLEAPITAAAHEKTPALFDLRLDQVVPIITEALRRVDVPGWAKQ